MTSGLLARNHSQDNLTVGNSILEHLKSKEEQPTASRHITKGGTLRGGTIALSGPSTGPNDVLFLYIISAPAYIQSTGYVYGVSWTWSLDQLGL